VKLIHGDCLEVMKDIPDKSIDLCFTSPPYNMNLRIRNGKHCSRQIVKEISTKYENDPDNLSMEDFFEFNKKIINELLRACKLSVYNIQFLTGNKSAFFKLIGEFSENIKEIVIWDKVNAQPAIGVGVLNSQFEVLLFISGDKKNAMTRRFEECGFKRGTLSNLWRIKRGKKIYKNHGATFPLELSDKIISNFSNENDIVLDPFLGTGTTALSAKNLNRRFIGIEKDDKYFEIAKKRIEEILK
jgi:site-specific DNA-methyltransferase (adenine-specific)